MDLALGIDGVDLFALSTSTAERSAVRAALKPLCEESRLAIQSLEELQSGLHRTLNGVIAAFWVVLLLLLIVGSLGVFNTLATNTAEQSVQLGLLRIVGMTRGQIYRVVFSQATILALVGVLVGCIAGLTTAYIMHRCIQLLLSRQIAFVWRPELFFGCSLAALLLTWAAAYLPARRAAREQLTLLVQSD